MLFISNLQQQLLNFLILILSSFIRLQLLLLMFTHSITQIRFEYCWTLLLCLQYWFYLLQKFIQHNAALFHQLAEIFYSHLQCISFLRIILRMIVSYILSPSVTPLSLYLEASEMSRNTHIWFLASYVSNHTLRQTIHLLLCSITIFSLAKQNSVFYTYSN